MSHFVLTQQAIEILKNYCDVEKDVQPENGLLKVPMTYITSEPYIGHLDMGGAGDSKYMMEQELTNRHFKKICKAKIHQVTDSLMIVHE